MDESVAVEQAEAETAPEREAMYCSTGDGAGDGGESEPREEGDIGVRVAGEGADAIGGGFRRGAERGESSGGEAAEGSSPLGPLCQIVGCDVVRPLLMKKREETKTAEKVIL